MSYILYVSVVRCLMFAMVYTTPNLTLAVNVVSKFY